MNLTTEDRASLLAQARELARHGSRMAYLLVEVWEELAKKDNLIRGLCDRVEAQSQLLAKRAELTLPGEQARLTNGG